jgi:release factor glutamine methyltransferase
MLEALETDLAGYALRADLPMADDARDRFADMARRCCEGEPVQYILGWWEFGGLRLRTDRRALIPRPETEEVARKAAALAGGGSVSVADVGCGTGCIGLYVASRRPLARVTLFDISPDALSLASENAEALRLRVHIAAADMARPLPGGPYDLLVSNPPYAARHELASLPCCIRDREPLIALDGGSDGLDAYRALARRLTDSLTPGGWMVLEVGAGQHDAVLSMLSPHCDTVEVHSDLSGIPRVVAARRI